MPSNKSAPTYITATIAAGQSLTPQINMGAETLYGILMPTPWTPADLTFQVSSDNGATFHEMFTSAGTAMDFPVAAGNYIAVDPTFWRGVNCIKIRSGTLGTPVNQAASATLTLTISAG